MGKSLISPEVQAAYDQFVNQVPKLLSELADLIDVKELHFDLDTVDRVEKLSREFLKNENLFNGKTVQDSQRMMERIHAFIGEAMIQIVGGHWALNTAPRDDAFGKPVVVGTKAPDGHLYPCHVAEEQIAMLARRPKGAWRKVLEYSLNPTPV